MSVHESSLQGAGMVTRHRCGPAREERIGDWLASERRLALKDPDARPVSNQRPAVFLGFRLSRAGIGPGPKARTRLRRRLRRVAGGDSEHLARSLQAYRGMWRALGGN